MNNKEKIIEILHSLGFKPEQIGDDSGYSIVAVELLVVLHDQSRAIIHHERVRDLFVLSQFLPGNHLVGLDVSVGAVMGHADIHLHEAVGTLAPDGCFESCHLCSYFLNEVYIIRIRKYLPCSRIASVHVVCTRLYTPTKLRTTFCTLFRAFVHTK